VSAPKTPDDVAAWWFVQEATHALSPRERARMQAWLAEDPAHQAAYAKAHNVVGALGAHEHHPVIAEMRAQALQDVRNQARERRDRRFVPALAAAASVAFLAVVAWAVLPAGIEKLSIAALRDPSQIYQTMIGERSTVVLADGSELSLNTASRVRVTYTEEERRIELLGGEAHFDVARMPSRPFVVHAGDRRITAIGTSFDVRLPADGAPLHVTLLEGHVVVDREGPDLARTELKAGEQFIALPDGLPKVERIDPVRATAWREGRLILDNVELSDLVREANRYSKVKIVIADPQLAKLKVGGVYKVGRAMGIVEALTEYLPIQYRVDGDRILLLPRS
jgi:transmembrane sensor